MFDKIVAVIVTFEPKVSKLNELIDSLIDSQVSVVVVDNNSKKDFSIICEKELFKFRLSDNLGIAYAQNFGINKAIELGASKIIFFDQDSLIPPNFISDLYSEYLTLENNKENNICAIGPRFQDIKQGFFFPALRFNKFGLIDKLSVDNISEPIQVSFLISSGTMVSTDKLLEIGLMKTHFFIDFVDTEWCFRALDKGYILYMSKKAIMKHSIGDENLKILDFNIPVHSGSRRYYRIRNLFFMWKMAYIPKILVTKLMITNSAIQILLFLLKDKKIDYIKFYFKAIKDGIKQSKDY